MSARAQGNTFANTLNYVERAGSPPLSQVNTLESIERNPGTLTWAPPRKSRSKGVPSYGRCDTPPLFVEDGGVKSHVVKRLEF